MFKIITTGYFYADGGVMFGAIPKVTWSRSYPADNRNMCMLAMHTGVVRTADGHIIVVDPGVGIDRLNESPAVAYRFFDVLDIAESLRQTGIKPEEVTDVIFTHLHFDHCGAAVRKKADGTLTPLFSNATHWVSRAQYETEKKPHPLEDGSFLPENTEVLEEAGLLRLVEGSMEPFAGLWLGLYDGHTGGQIVAGVACGESGRSPRGKQALPAGKAGVACGEAALRQGESELCSRGKQALPAGEMGEMQTVVFAGDVIPLASQIVPERISAYDMLPARSYDGKVEILEKVASENAALVFYHDAYTACATIKKTGKNYKIEKKIGG